MRFTRLWAPMVATLTLILMTQPGTAAPPAPHFYVGGGTPVVKQAGPEALLDEGTMVCQPSKNRGIGGACLPFGSPLSLSWIDVNDIDAGRKVAFQVCLDNNGDGVCGTPISPPPCAGGDKILFSHSDTGAFFNPLGPLPNSVPPCPGSVGYKGFVVFLCEGVHTAPSGHTHPALAGSAQRTTSGSAGSGNFCGGPKNVPGKPYRVIP